MYIESFKQLTVWQRSIEVIRAVYSISAKLPESERFNLQSQMRRAAISIPANIAEGKKRKTKKDFLQFLRIADGSAAELETLLIICAELYPDISNKKGLALLEEVQKMLITLIRRLEASNS